MLHRDTARFKGFSQPVTQASSPSAAAHQTLYLASPTFCCFTLQHQVQGTQSWWSGICLLICRVSARFRDSLAAAFNLSAQLKAPDGTYSRALHGTASREARCVATQLTLTLPPRTEEPSRSVWRCTTERLS